MNRSARQHAAIDLEEILSRDTLRAITTYSSTSYFLYRGQPMGFEYELLKRFANHLDVHLELVIADNLEEMFQMLEAGAGDMIAHGLTITKSRKKRLRFSHPLLSTRQVLVQRKPDNWRKLRWHEIEDNLLSSPVELGGETVFVGPGSAFEERLLHLSEEIGEEIQIEKIKGGMTSEHLIKMVANGEIDYTVADEHVAQLNSTFIPDIDVSTPLSLEQNLAWAMRPASEKLDSVLSAYFASIENSLEYTMIYNRYFKYKKDFSRKIKSEYYVQRSGKLSDFDDLIKQYADSVGWNWHLLAAQVYQESRFDPRARSWAGAGGLMQIMPATARAYGVNVSDPESSIRGGVKYLKHLDEFWEEIIDERERIKFVLASYNVGPYHVKDAQRLAKKYGLDYCTWDGNVAYFLREKSKPEYFNDDVVKYGYCRGNEPIEYVQEILERSSHYARLLEV